MSVQVLDDGRTDGTLLGQTSTASIGFFGATPVVRPLGNAQAAITRGASAGLIMGFSATNSPASVATLTTAELAMTLVGGTGAPVSIASGDVLFITKPTSQAGLGLGNVRVSAANSAGVTFNNLSAGFLTPTASQVYSFVAIRGLTSTTAVLTPASVAISTTAEQVFTVPGIRVGELLQVSKATSQKGLDIVGMRVAGNNLVGITFANVTGTVLTPTAAETYTFISLGGVDAQNNEVVYQVSANTVAAVATLTSAQANITCTNIATSDMVIGWSKPTNQAGLIQGDARVSSAGFIGFTFGNFTTASITPTAGEVYVVGTRRPSLAGPLALYTPTLSPVSIAANTTAEQGFTITGLVTSSMAWVNKPSVQNGLGIVGVRVSAVNVLAITFANYTSNTLTPTQGEVYTVGNFQMPVEATGNSWLMTAQVVEQQSAAQASSVRNSLVSLGLMAGA